MKIEDLLVYQGDNRARGEALETVHHLYIAKLKKYISEAQYQEYRNRYLECVRMLNGMEKSLDKQLDPKNQRWPHLPEP